MASASINKKPIIRPVQIGEIHQLQKLCQEIYPIHFGDYWESDGLAIYMDDHYGIKRLTSDLTDSSIDYFFIYQNKKVVGFLKIFYQTSNPNFDPQTTSELEKIYIAPEYIGQGIGQIAMRCVLDIIKAKGKNMLILDVLDTNFKGISFYEKFGFILHSTTKLNYPNFKEELSGLNLMYYSI